MSEQKLFQVYVGDEFNPKEIMVNSKDTGFQITDSLRFQLGIFENTEVEFDPEKDLEFYPNIKSLKLKVDDSEDSVGSIRNNSYRRPSVLAASKNKKSSRFDISVLPKNIISSQDVLFGSRNSIKTEAVQQEKPVQIISNNIDVPIKLRRRSTSTPVQASQSTQALVNATPSIQSNIDEKKSIPSNENSFDGLFEFKPLALELQSLYPDRSRKSTLIRPQLQFTKVIRPQSLCEAPDNALSTMQCSFMRINLPNNANTMVKLPDEFSMDTVLLHVCQKRQLDFNLYTLHHSEKVNVELDRTLKYYAVDLNIKEMSLVLGEKVFTTMIDKEDGQDAMIYQSRHDKIHVIAANTTKIIERITDIDFIGTYNFQVMITEDTKFINMALLTFRSYITPIEFFGLLMDRFECVLPDNPSEEDVAFFKKNQYPTQKRTIDVITMWVEQYWQDFALNSDLKRELKIFAMKLERPEFISEGIHLKQLMAVQSSEFDIILNSHKAVERKGKKIESMFEKMDADEIGQQLCLYNFQLFKNIHSVEYLYQIWNPKKPGEDEESLTPVLDFFIKRFDIECYWVATEICRVPDLKKRIAALKKIIKAAQFCFESQNFFSMFAFYFGLNMNPVQRLKKTWDGLSDKTKKIYADIERMTEQSKNMKNFRDHLAKCKAPIIPFLPIYLKDLTFMNDGNPSRMNGMINFEKLRMMAHCVRQIRNLTSVDFPFQVIPEIQNFLSNPSVEKDLAKLKQQSLSIES